MPSKMGGIDEHITLLTVYTYGILRTPIFVDPSRSHLEVAY